MNQRMVSQRALILKALRQQGSRGVTNKTLSTISLRYTAHLSELRSEGYIIAARDLGDGLFSYVLTAEPEEKRQHRRALDIFFDVVKNEYDNIVDVDMLKEILEKHGLNVVHNWGKIRDGVA